MSKIATPDNNEPVPFFADPRTLTEQLYADRRDWIPTKPEEKCPPIISGLVLELGTYTDLNGEEVPTLRLLTDDLQIEWSVIGFHGWLKNAIRRKNPNVNDYVLLAFRGVKPTRKKGESDAFMYDLLVARNPDPPPASPVGNAPQEVDDPPSMTDDDLDGVPF